MKKLPKKNLPSMKALQAGVQGGLLRTPELVGVRRSEAALEAAAQKYWNEPHEGRGSHWQGTARFTRGDLWTNIGLRHHDMLRRACRTLDCMPENGRVQIKYDTGSWRTMPRRLAYRFSPGNMTTFPIHAFWQLAARCGFEPKYVELVPKDELDERYAYFVLVRPAAPRAPRQAGG
jgi:hypothetical protein